MLKFILSDPTSPEMEEDSNSNCPSTAAEAANSSVPEGSAVETLQVKCLTKYQNKLDNTISERNLQPLSLISKSESIDGKPSWSSVGCKVQSNLNLGSGWVAFSLCEEISIFLVFVFLISYTILICRQL